MACGPVTWAYLRNKPVIWCLCHDCVTQSMPIEGTVSWVERCRLDSSMDTILAMPGIPSFGAVLGSLTVKRPVIDCLLSNKPIETDVHPGWGGLPSY